MSIEPYYQDDTVTLLHGDQGKRDRRTGHVVSGADKMAGDVARTLGMPVKAMPADWLTHGKRAGYLRNREMLATLLPFLAHGHSVEVYAFANPSLEESPGTRMMVSLALKADVSCWLWTPEGCQGPVAA